MNVMIEFLGDDAIENVITCLHYKMDKAIYFGYKENIREYKTKTEEFLKKYCSVDKVDFIEISQTELDMVVSKIRTTMQCEVNHSNKVYVDLTGGESLCLIAFGIVSGEYCFPMHMYDVEKDSLMEYASQEALWMSKNVPKRKVKLTIERYIEMYGGVILPDEESAKQDENGIDSSHIVERIWMITKKYKNYWNPFSDFLRLCFKPDDDLRVSQNRNSINSLLKKNNKQYDMDKIFLILRELNDKEIICNLCIDNQKIGFRYGSEWIQDVLWKGGSMLELHTFYQEKQKTDDCIRSVKLDWDGVIHDKVGVDVYNEVDVLELKGNVLTFISCKSGNLDGPMALHALYELQTVAQRFGGKYAKKKMVIMQLLRDVHLDRAREMDIKVEIGG